MKVVVIGAGIYGLVAAKTYLQLEPAVELIIIDSEETVGGVWSEKRIYPGLYVQLVYPLFEYYDFPMRPDGMSEDGYIPGSAIHSYLHDYAVHFGLLKFIQFSTWVESVERKEGRWKILTRCIDDATATKNTLYCDKLIVASGPTSKAYIPDIPRENFSKTVIHSRDIGANIKKLDSPEVQKVLIVGGAKSAYDAAFLALYRGKKVEWVMREGGGGPMAIFPPTFFGIFNAMHVASTRLISKLSPSYYASSDWWYRILQKSWLGSRITKGIWGGLRWINAWYGGYNINGAMENLRPTPDSAFWCNAGLGCASAPRFWKVLHAGLSTGDVHRDEISLMQDNKVYLRNSGKVLKTDFVIFCTGWDDDISIFEPSMSDELGLPRKGQGFDEKTSADSGAEQAEAKLEDRYPLLSSPPISRTVEEQRKWRLYRRIVPLSLAASGNNSLVFLGQIHTISTMMLSGVQSLWAVAYLRGDLSLPKIEEMTNEVVEFNTWTRRRYLSAGTKFPYSIYDFLPYIDILCRDLGIREKRKANGIRELLEPYGPRDYTTLIEEWRVQKEKKDSL